MEQFLITNEAIEDYWRRHKQEGFIFKVGFEKAYDHVGLELSGKGVLEKKLWV